MSIESDLELYPKISATLNSLAVVAGLGYLMIKGGDVDMIRGVLKPAIVVLNLVGLYATAYDVFNVAFGSTSMVWVSNSPPENLAIGRPARVLGLAMAAIGIALNLSLS